MSQEVKCVDDYPNCHGGIKTESLVAYDMEVGAARGKVLGDVGNCVVFAYKDGYALQWRAVCYEAIYALLYTLHHVFLLSILWHQLYDHLSVSLVVWPELLFHVVVCFLKLVGHGRAIVPEIVTFNLGSGTEEGVVECHHVAL